MLPTTQTRLQYTAIVSVSFIVGSLFTLALNKLYKVYSIEDLQVKRKSRSNLSSSQFVDNDPAVSKIPEIPEGIEGLIGKTPLFKIKSLSEATGCLILAKAEFLNGAGGSTKDRVALHIIRTAEDQGHLRPGKCDTIYEGTVGSTGISLASLARALGYKAHICMPDDQSQEKTDLLLCLGANIEKVTPAPITSTEHYVNLARERAAEHNRANLDSRGFFADQFENLANFKAHYTTTGPEIWHQTGGHLDAFVAGAGTGGTISGIALYLKEQAGLSKRLDVILADPEGSGLYNKIKHGVMFSSTEKEGTRRRSQVDSIVEGIGLNRMTNNIEAGLELIDDSVKVSDIQAMEMAKWLAENDGIFIGSSSAVNCVAAVVTALRMPRGSRIVTVLCDSGNRHLSKFWKEIAFLDQEIDHDGLKLLNRLGIKDNIKRRKLF